MEFDLHERQLLKSFLKWLQNDEQPISLDGRTIEHRAEFHPEEPKDRKTRLRVCRERRKMGQLSDEEQQSLDLLEKTSFYSNRYECVYAQKPARQKAHGNVHEAKRLYVIALVRRRLWPDDSLFDSLLSLEIELPSYMDAAPRGLEIRLRQFEREQIESGPLTCLGVVEERFARFKSFCVGTSILHLSNAPGPEQPAERMAFLKEQGALMAITESERALLASLCEYRLFQNTDIK